MNVVTAGIFEGLSGKKLVLHRPRLEGGDLHGGVQHHLHAGDRGRDRAGRLIGLIEGDHHLGGNRRGTVPVTLLVILLALALGMATLLFRDVLV